MAISYVKPVVRNPYAWPSGTAALPGVFFANDAGVDSGFYLIGANNIGMSLGGTKAWDFAAALAQFTGANSTNNTRLLVENTTNDAGANHAIVDVTVGGTTTIGDPQYRATIPSGTSWYWGADNSNNDVLNIGVGTVVGTTAYIGIDPRTSGVTNLSVIEWTPQNISKSNAATTVNFIAINGYTLTMAGTTQVTSLGRHIWIRGITLAQSGGAVTVDAYTAVGAIPPITGASVTLTVSSGFRVENPAANAGTNTNLIGLVVESLTSGTNNIAIWVQNPIQLGNATANTTANQFHTASQGAATTTMYIGNASINVTSDVRLKRDIALTTIDASLLIRQMPIKDFFWDDPSDTAPGNRNSRGRWTGMMAQDVVDVVPWLVNAPDRHCAVCRSGLPCRKHEGSWQIDFNYMVPLIVKGWQEHDGRIAWLEQENLDLRAKLIAAGVLIP